MAVSDVKVALVWLGAISRDTGGRTYLREILRPLAASPRLDLDLYLTDSEFDVPSGLRVHYYPYTRRPAGRLAMEAFVVRRIRRRRYDVLFAPFNYLPAAWNGPSVVVQHNLLAGKGAKTAAGVIRAAYRRRAVASSVRRATRVIAVSDHLRECLLEWYPDVNPSRVRVVPLAPATELTSARPQHATSKQRFVLVVGALWSHKGVEDAVDVFGLLAERYPDLQLLLAGPGSAAAQSAILDRAELRGIRERVLLLGHLAHAELASRYRSAAALLFLSRIESFGLPVVEAMAMGVPVVARRLPALLEVAGDAPLWVDREADASSIAEVLDKALADQHAREQAISRGLSRTALLSWSKTAQLTAEVLIEAAGELPRIEQVASPARTT
jgi:glycosyltransferase involved in cell wall biosynthesis